MIYEIKAIPTTYAGVNFRSRLEARWAAFFDLCGWKWDYEPFDMEGWAPDFKIKVNDFIVLVEVKSADPGEENISVLSGYFAKACLHAMDHYVLLLCAAPRDCAIGIPVHKYDPPDSFISALRVTDSDAKWREAGNQVQWRPDEPTQDIAGIIKRAAAKARSAA